MMRRIGALIIAIPDALRDKLGAEGARALAQLLNQLGGEVRDAVITFAEERFERRLTEATRALEIRLVDRMAELETRLNERIGGLEARIGGLEGRMGDLEIRLSERMRKLESRLLGWAFALWLGQFAVLIGILFAFFQN